MFLYSSQSLSGLPDSREDFNSLKPQMEINIVQALGNAGTKHCCTGI